MSTNNDRIRDDTLEEVIEEASKGKCALVLHNLTFIQLECLTDAKDENKDFTNTQESNLIVANEK